MRKGKAKNGRRVGFFDADPKWIGATCAVPWMRKADPRDVDVYTGGSYAARIKAIEDRVAEEDPYLKNRPIRKDACGGRKRQVDVERVKAAMIAANGDRDAAARALRMTPTKLRRFMRYYNLLALFPKAPGPPKGYTSMKGYKRLTSAVRGQQRRRRRRKEKT